MSSEESQLLSNPLVGGLILFARNYESPVQLKRLVSQVRKVAPDCVIAVDHEGGRVQRFREGFTPIPPMGTLGQLYNADKDKALGQSFEYASIIARELGAFDIDITFAPVLDRDYGESEVIGDRAFADKVESIVELSHAFIEGMNAYGMASTGKHFPGHGAVKADSHIDIPYDHRDYDVIESNDMIIFKRLIDHGLNAVMPAHVIYDKVDTRPAGFSPVWIKEILRKKLSFDGVVFSDDLSMEGASVAGSYEDRADAALKAGCDMVLVCNDRAAALKVLNHLETHYSLEDFYTQSKRLRKMKLDRSKQLPLSVV